MTESVLAGCRILVAEDEYLLASETARLLRHAGATIVGPVGTMAKLHEKMEMDAFDLAILDIRLDQELVYPAADLIRESGVPFAFLTGYNEASVPPRFVDVPLCPKPCPDETLIGIVHMLYTG